MVDFDLRKWWPLSLVCSLVGAYVLFLSLSDSSDTWQMSLVAGAFFFGAGAYITFYEFTQRLHIDKVSRKMFHRNGLRRVDEIKLGDEVELMIKQTSGAGRRSDSLYVVNAQKKSIEIPMHNFRKRNIELLTKELSNLGVVSKINDYNAIENERSRLKKWDRDLTDKIKSFFIK